MVKEFLVKSPPPLAGEGWEGACGLTVRASLEELPPLASLRSPPPPQAGEEKYHQFPVTIRTMTGQRITTNSTGKMQIIIGSESLAGKL